MGRRVVELEGQMQGGRSAREVEMEAELAQVGGLMVEGGGNCAGQLRAGAWSWVKRGWRVSCAGQRHDRAQVCGMQIKKNAYDRMFNNNCHSSSLPPLAPPPRPRSWMTWLGGWRHQKTSASMCARGWPEPRRAWWRPTLDEPRQTPKRPRRCPAARPVLHGWRRRRRRWLTARRRYPVGPAC